MSLTHCCHATDLARLLSKVGLGRMAQPLFLYPEAYSRSFQCFLDSTYHREKSILKCIEDHIVPVIKTGVCKILEEHSFNESPFRVLSVGSGEGGNDINLLDALSKIPPNDGEAMPMVNRVVEQNADRLAAFRAKAPNIREHFKGRANVDFEWIQMTFQEYSSQKKADDDKFDVVHFIHSIYYLGVEDALVHCYEKELARQGMLISITESEASPICKYAEKFGDRLIDSMSRNNNVVDVAREKGWKYFVCSGDFKILDITSIFNSSSLEGNSLLDFLTYRMGVRQNENSETVDKMLRFWEEQSTINEQGKRIVQLGDNAVIIVKGFES